MTNHKNYLDEQYRLAALDAEDRKQKLLFRSKRVG